MPVGAVASKVAACRGYGAEVVLHGTHVGESLAHLEVLRAERGLTLVHPYDDPEVLIGNGSCGLEILDDLPDVDVVVAGIGGGGLIGGVATAIKERKPSVRVYGVEPVGSEAMTRGLEAGEPVRVAPVSVADGLGAPSAGRYALDVVQRYVEDVVLIDDPTILAGLRFGVERLKQVLEPAGSAALAAVLTGAIPIRDGDRVCVILSGRQRRGRAAGRAAGDGGAAPGALVDPQLRQPVLVLDAQVVGELVEDRDPDLVREVVGVREVLLERQPEQQDPRRHRDRSPRPTRIGARPRTGRRASRRPRGRSRAAARARGRRR